MLEPEPVTLDPWNAETPAAALWEPVTPVGAFFVRNHFPVPKVDREGWRMRIGGAVARPREVRFRDLLALPTREVEVVMECAGNGRTLMAPVPEGTPWGDRAVGAARFRGASFRDLVEWCGLDPAAGEIVFAGADKGEAHGHPLLFERSLPAAKALHPDTIVAWEMNGEALTPDHGAPVRLLVPGWYGVASVKWLVEARAVTTPFAGHFQREHYTYAKRKDDPAAPTVTALRVKSFILAPQEGARVPLRDPCRIEGRAWSGAAPVSRVEVSTDGGQSWAPASLAPAAGPYAWRAWHHEWRPSRAGAAVILARAYDEAGNMQPFVPDWNVRGYGNNAVQAVRVRVA